MSSDTKYTETECRRRFAVECFNRVWTLLEKMERSRDEGRKLSLDDLKTIAV